MPASEDDYELTRQRTEEYGGNDPREPSRKDGRRSLSPAADKVDPNRVGWDSSEDPENPQLWSTPYRWFLTVLCLLMTVNVTFASSAPSFATPFIAAHFRKTDEVGYLVTSLFLIGYVVGPLIWGPGSELYGRRVTFRVALAGYTILHLGQALARNMETLLITRFLGGVFAVAPLTNCAGVIVDIWDPVRRGIAAGLFVAGVFIGPVLGPIIGGFVTSSYLGWRWVFWVMMIFAGTCTVIAFLFLPETYAPVILQWKARRLRKADPVKNAALYSEHEQTDWSWRGILHRTLYRPIQMLAMEPILVLVTLYMSLVYGVLYSLFEALPIIFIGVHGFTLGRCGLIFIGVGIGTTIGAASFVLLMSHYPRLLVEWHGFPPPEQRLFGAMIGGPLLVIGAFWLGWTGNYPSVPWYVPALATIPIGASVSMVFISFIAYLVDTYLIYAASALAANTMIRSAVAAAFPLFTVQMFTNLGINWACTLIGLLALLMAPSPYLFYKFGPWIREKSTFAPSPDLIIARKLKEKAAAEAPKDG
ncbi:MFS polyamine transporter [Amylocystis lapponica]|nr:MFS polyamine transporter [Amylocystis lapponica]